MVELVKGYGITVSKRSLDEVSLEPTPGRAVRKLMSIFFSEEKLARSSCYGTNKTGEEGNESLDGDIVAACISE